MKHISHSSVSVADVLLGGCNETSYFIIIDVAFEMCHRLNLQRSLRSW